MVSSQNALLYAYALYLIGHDRYAVPEHALQKVIARWFFFTTLTGRYTNGPESVMDGDLNRIGGCTTPAQFVQALDGVMDTELTEDYWRIALPAALDSSSARNPQLFAYVAAQNRLGAPVLFSHKTVADLIDPALKLKKKALERHHLFPRGWLEKQGITDLKIINQMANFALLEWPDNIAISDSPPSSYLPAIRGRFSDGDWRRMHELHAFPDGWEDLDYSAFLVERRKLMAAIIRRGFQTLT
jgi:hypothetical protein